MKESIWVRQYEVNTYLLNPRRKLGLFGLLNLVQDTAWAHATHLGHGYEAMMQSGLIWVLTRQKVILQEWPNWGDVIEIKTWVRPFESVFANRDFEFYVNGEKIGECTTSWITLDAQTRKPKRIDLDRHRFECRADYQLSLNAAKIELKNDLKETAEFRVRNSDLDLNGHVNNTHYAQWILDSIPRGIRRQYWIKKYEVNFLSETNLEDEIAIEMSDLESVSSGDFLVQFQGRRESDQVIVFSARLLVYRSFSDI